MLAASVPESTLSPAEWNVALGDADGPERLVDVDLLAPVAEVARARQLRRRQVERALQKLQVPLRRRAAAVVARDGAGRRALANLQRAERRARAPSANACETRSASRSTALPDGDTVGAFGRRRARLLRHVGELVRDEPPPLGRARIVLAVAEVDVLRPA